MTVKDDPKIKMIAGTGNLVNISAESSGALHTDGLVIAVELSAINMPKNYQRQILEELENLLKQNFSKLFQKWNKGAKFAGY